MAYNKKFPSKKTKMRRLTNDLLAELTDLCFELDEPETKFDYVQDFCDNIQELIYKIKGLCHNGNGRYHGNRSANRSDVNRSV